MFSWAATIRAVARKDEPTKAHLESILEACSATLPERRPRDFVEIAQQLQDESYVKWGQGLQRLQQRFEGERLSNGNRTAVEAITLLAQEREVWRQRCSACSSEEVSQAYFFLSIAYLKAAKPRAAVKALQKSVVWHPEHAWCPEWLGYLGIFYGSLGDAGKQRDHLERALRIKESHYGPEHPEMVFIM
eukprot:842459-Amphidinium_carterae.1